LHSRLCLAPGQFGRPCLCDTGNARANPIRQSGRVAANAASRAASGMRAEFDRRVVPVANPYATAADRRTSLAAAAAPRSQQPGEIAPRVDPTADRAPDDELHDDAPPSIRIQAVAAASDVAPPGLARASAVTAPAPALRPNTCARSEPPAPAATTHQQQRFTFQSEGSATWAAGSRVSKLRHSGR